MTYHKLWLEEKFCMYVIVVWEHYLECADEFVWMMLVAVTYVEQNEWRAFRPYLVNYLQKKRCLK
jgi:hypothetical protein